MAIAYVNGTTNSTGAGTATTLTLTYTSAGGALVLSFMAFLGGANITSITDSASNAWTFVGGVANTSGSFFTAYTTSATPTAVTSVVIHATTATNICAVLGEYSGCTTMAVSSQIAAISAATPATTGAFTIVSGNWAMATCGCQTLNALPVFSSSSGTLRNSATMTLPAAYGFAGCALVDNTVGTSVTDAAAFTGTYLTALGLVTQIH